MRHLLATAALACLTSAAAAEPAFVARTAGGKEFAGPLARLAADWSAEVGKGVRHKVAAGDLVELRQAGVPLPPLPTGDHLLTTAGDRLPFLSLRLEGEKLFVRHPDLGADEVSLPLSSVALVWRRGTDRAAEPAKLRRALLAAERPRDVLVLRNGDRIEGTLHAIDDHVRLDADKKRYSIPWAQAAAVALSTALADKPNLPPQCGRLTLTATDRSPGGRLTVVAPAVVNDELRARTLSGAIVKVPLERVASLEPVGGRAVALSSLKPAAYEYRPYLDEKFGYGLGATATGRDLRVGGSWHERGVGMHADSSLSFDVAGHERFEALVGLDDAEGRRGRVRVRVLLDGKPAYAPGDVLTHRDGPWRVAVALAGAKRLTLEALPAGDGPVQAAVDWVEARLIRAAAK